MIEDSKPEIVFRLLVDSVGEINGEAENILWIRFLACVLWRDIGGWGGGEGQGNTLGRCLVSD